ncbi:cyclic lactone autoinducer peptide [Lachnospiraceae bacterium ZAX-1]
MRNQTSKTSLKLHKLLCAVAKRSANSGAGLASILGYYQPKVPERISK